MRPTFTVLIGTKGRDSLIHSLESIARQRRIEGDQCLVGIDALEVSSSRIGELMALVESYGAGFVARPYVGIADEAKIIPPAYSGTGRAVAIAPGQPYHWLGVEQINNLLRTETITGSHVFTIGDDDVFVDGAYDVLRRFCVVDLLCPVIYKFLAPNRWRLWDRPRMAPGLISGCCIAAPTWFVPLMHTRIETTHDYDWMVEILKKAAIAGRRPLWLDWVGVIARPDARGHDVAHQGVYECPHCFAWTYKEDVTLTFGEFNCRRCQRTLWAASLDTVGVMGGADPPEAPNAYMAVEHPRYGT